MTDGGRLVEIHVVADSTGDTGARVARAVQAQFPDLEVTVVRHPRLHDEAGVEDVLAQLRAAPEDTVVFCTVVDLALRERVLHECGALGVPCADLMAPALDAVVQCTGVQPARVVQPVGLAADYFERIHAMEFAIANDDGRLTDGLDEAQIVLVGASRTGKTPLSMYLGYLGYRTANIPLVPGIAPPADLLAVEPWKLVGLTIDPQRLLTIRKRRVDLMRASGRGAGGLGGYADLARIHDELDEVARLQRRLGCPVLDTTSLALEEAAGRVIELVTARRRAHLAHRADPHPLTEETDMTEHTYVYDFAAGSAEMKQLLGGKGAGLAEMMRIGVPVPDGFTVTTEACVAAMRAGGAWPGGLWEEIEQHLDALQQRTGRTLGAADRPLLVSVRSGAVVSMPGMMDTILNLGISDEAAAGLAAETGNARFAWDSHRRFVQMYAEVVEGVPAHAFEDELTALKARRGVTHDTELDVDDLRGLVDTFRRVAREHGADLPTDPREQLRRAVSAVFASWDNPRAGVYRQLNGIPDDLGTAVNVQQMVFGNKGPTSATGVAFTRNPSTGVKELYGEFLTDAQGEDVVAGIRTPRPLRELQAVLPEAYDQFIETMRLLEGHYRDMQDIEFTIEEKRLYLLQTRTGKRTAAAALRIARDMVAEGIIDRATALERIEPAQLDQLLHPGLDPAHGATPITRGLNASPGAAVGQVVFDADTAAVRGKAGDAVVLVRWETTPDDIHGVVAAQGVLTAHGGMTSHAAVVARGMGKPCVAGAGELRIDAAARTVTVGDTVLTEADTITLDGSTGDVYVGALELVRPEITDDFREVLGWADDVRRLGVRANADTGADAAKARELGAEGVGLCRTEHMFMAAERLPVVQAMILADTAEGRAEALDQLLPMQQSDFEEIFTAMSGLPVTIRLIDPPLHEFLPDLVEQSLEVQRLEGAGTGGPQLDAARRMLAQVKRLSEMNPMLGTRGVRLSLLYPEIAVMQTRAIVRAALAVRARGGDPRVEIMVPLVGFAEELRRMRAVIVETVDAELAAAGATLDYAVGTMIELPRAALTADQIAEHADFFSFGTNDLTQTTVGISRDDAEGSFLGAYLEAGILAANPFASVDPDGVGELVRIGVQKGRAARAALKTGVCGEHGGDPASIALFDGIGLDYVSCSPYRVPLARLAAARATLAKR